MGFYRNVETQYGKNRTTLLKQYAKNVNIATKILPSKVFLLKCRKWGIIPKFIINSTRNITGLLDKNSKYTKNLNTVITNFHRKLLNVVILDKCNHTQHTQNKIYTLQEEILNRFPSHFSHSFLTLQKTSKEKKLNTTKQRLIKKFDHLYNNLISKLNLTVDEKSLVNLTDVNVPIDVQWLLSLGPKFALPQSNTGFPVFDIITDSEEAIKTILDPKIKDIARAKIANIITKHRHLQTNNMIDITINNIHINTQKFLRQHPSIIIINSDKGKSVVLMYKQQYIEKVETLLKDTTTYKKVLTDPTNKLQVINNKIIHKLVQQKIIEKKDKYKLLTYNRTSPKLYALPKIHKPNIPMRPIVASIDTVSSQLSKMLSDILKHLVEDSPYIIKNSIEFKKRVSGLTIEKTESMVSFDVVSLFTNIPIPLAMEVINDQWNKLRNITNIPKDIFFEMLHFCLVSANYFVFNNIHYKQVYGMPMGNPLSSIIADIITEDLLRITLEKLSFTPMCFVKYVDDIFTIVPTGLIDETLSMLNDFHPKLQFTVEVEQHNKIPYLDVMVIKNANNQIETDWYHKHTSSNRILNFYSNHPHFQKINTARNFISRVLSLSTQKFHTKNKQIIHNTLTLNNYPRHTIQKLIATVTHKLNNTTTINNHTTTTRNIYKSMTYVKGVSEQIQSVITAHSDNTLLAYKTTNCLRNTFTKLKDPIPLLKRANVIYKIPCAGNGEHEPCNLAYVGQTTQYCGNRLNNHRRDLRRVNDSSVPRTALMDHFQQHNHYPDFSSVSILNTQRNYSKRLTIEALHIYTQNTYNIKRDTDDLSAVFCNIINDTTHNKTHRKRTRSNTHTTPQHTDTSSHNFTHTIKKRKITLE